MSKFTNQSYSIT